MSEEKSKIYVQKIKIKNFRSYYGDNEIKLSDDPKKTITIIHGRMGAGKTTLMDAMYWCLYGEDRPKPQSRSDSDEGLVNKNVFSLLEVGKKDTMEVELTVSDEQGPKFFLKRGIEIEKVSDETTTKKNNTNMGNTPRGINLIPVVSLTRRKPRGGPADLDLPITEVGKVNAIIETIFPKSVSAFFLFDAELLDKFFQKTGNNFVKKGIEVISGLPILQKASRNFDDVKTAIQEQITSAGPDLKISGDNLNAARQSLKEFEDEYTKVQTELQDNNDAISAIEEWLDKHGDVEVTSLREQEKNLANDIKNLNGRLDEINNAVKCLILEAGSKLLLRDTLNDAESIFQKKEEAGELPTPITRKALDSMINKSKCLCGRDLEGQWLENIQQLKSKTSSSPLIRHVDSGRSVIDRVLYQIEPIKLSEQIGILRTQRESASGILSDKLTEKNKVSSDLTNIDQKEISKVKGDKNNLELVVRPDIYRRMGSIERDLKLARAAAEDAEDIFNKKTSERKEFERENKKMLLAKTCAAILEQLRNELIDNLRTDAEDITTKYFLDLVSEEEFSKVRITKDYETIALGPDGASKSISAGQGHCIALAYIAAMREITKHHYFMVIDSAMHNISSEERVEIAKGFKKYLPGTQITMLVQNQEYTGSAKEDIVGPEIATVRDTLLDNKLVSREYILKKLPPPKPGLNPITKIELLHDFSKEK